MRQINITIHNIIHIAYSARQEGKNDPQKRKKRNKFRGAGCSLLKADGFSCSLNVFYEGLSICKLQFLIIKKYSAVIFFFHFLVIKTLDLDPDPPDPDWYGRDKISCA
jgi:hypothetical protein